MFQINMLLTFSMGDDCPCPTDIQGELFDFHNQLQLHCGETQAAFPLQFFTIKAIFLKIPTFNGQTDYFAHNAFFSILSSFVFFCFFGIFSRVGSEGFQFSASQFALTF